MINKISYLCILFFVLSGCTKDSSELTSPFSSSGENGGSGNQNQAGVITAGEWNDLENWAFWDSILSKEEYIFMPDHWAIHNNHRISVKVISEDASPVINASVKLKRDGSIIFNARTDNKGIAELWVDIFQYSGNIDYSKLEIDVNNGTKVISEIKPYNDGINHIMISPTTIDNKIEVCFVVDATGSMDDELEYLKTELLDVISKIKNDNPNSTVNTSSVFYRDEGDEYVTRLSGFTPDINITTDFIKNQSADGGGDFPEAVHSALDKATNELQWSTNAKTRIMFLILDAPPHYNNTVISDIQSSIIKAADKGIRIIPITASGINKETEFLMRFMSITTNGTYVFITDHSGVGNSHLTATVGEYEVEYLNNLMIRLVNEYAE